MLVRGEGWGNLYDLLRDLVRKTPWNPTEEVKRDAYLEIIDSAEAANVFGTTAIELKKDVQNHE